MKAGDTFGEWVAVRPIGAGGMGSVWVVRNPRTQEHGALKVLRGDAEAEEERFTREVEVLGHLHHPAIVRLLGDGREGKEPWLVMSYAPGETLEARLARQEPIPLDDALRMFAALADGLRHAHEGGIHHRDVKAENVVLGADGWATLVDFGVALKHGASRLTSAGFVMGTFSYLAPEVVTGGERDPALADIYAFGQLLCEVLTGRPLFRGDPDETRSSRRWSVLVAEKSGAEPLDPGEPFDARLRAIVRNATEPEPEERTGTMREVADGLHALLDPVQTRELGARIGRATNAGPPDRSIAATDGGSWWLVAGVVGGFLVVGGGFAAVLLAGLGLWWML